MKHTKWILLLTVLFFSMVSVVWAQPQTAVTTYNCGTPTQVILYAGQTTNAGSVTVWNDQTNLYVRYQTTGGWVMTESHLAVATTLAGIPQTSTGNPRVGNFPYKTTHNPAVTDFTYTIPLASVGYVPGDNLFIAAHAVVQLPLGGGKVRIETGWGDGTQFPGKNWAMYFRYLVQPCIEENPPIQPGDFRTQTQGGWGTVANGKNPGSYRDAHFAGAFPNGVTIGGTNSALFTSSTAVEVFLPQGGPASTLARSYVDPTSTTAGVLAGQVTALSLSVGFDYFDPDFGRSTTNLADLVVVDSTSVCRGMSVQAVLDTANAIIGGNSTAFTPSQINGCVAAINENFVDGTTVGTYLGYP